MELHSGKSRKNSLLKISEGKAGLTQHRMKLLNRVPSSGDWASFTINSIEIIDLAYLTAKENHEFALLRGKNSDILFHGSRYKCEFDELLSDLLKRKKLRIIAHSHPYEDIPIPSNDDRKTLLQINQEKSIIISATTGICTEFTKYQY